MSNRTAHPGPERAVDAIRNSAFFGAVAASRRLNYIYVQNWKCGSSTVRSTLWAAEHELGLAAPADHPHQPSSNSPFAIDPRRWEHVDRQFVFTIVRNPYVRVLSAYLDKIHHHRDHKVWGRFAGEQGLGDDRIEFIEFLRILARTAEDRMDPHWRPQSYNLAPSVVPYDFIGSLENFESDLRHILQQIFPDREVPIKNYKPHHTGSTDKLTQYYGKEELRLAQSIYARDFAELGYDLDLAALGPPAPRPKPDSTPIAGWGRAFRLLGEDDYAGAEREFVALRPWIRGVILEEQLLRCRCEQVRFDRDAIERNVAALERELARGYEEWSVWKWYGRGLVRIRRWEDGVRALLLAIQLHPAAGPQRRRRRRLLWRLAVLRASKGDLADALGVLAARPRRPMPPKFPRLRLVRSRVRRTVLLVTAALANLTAAARWHPDRSVGIPGTRSSRDLHGASIPVEA